MFSSDDSHMFRYCGTLIPSLKDGETACKILKAYAKFVGVGADITQQTFNRPQRPISPMQSFSDIMGYSKEVEPTRKVHYVQLDDGEFILNELKFINDEYDAAEAMMLISVDSLGAAYDCIRRNNWGSETFSITKYYDNYAIFFSHKNPHAVMTKLSLP